MKPADFRDFVHKHRAYRRFSGGAHYSGGDHLGPNCWQDEPAAVAMEKSIDLIKAHVAAGFSKIHLDASMSCADDPVPLDPKVFAERAARLCQAAEETASDEQKRHLTYVIGTEVPVPGGGKPAPSAAYMSPGRRMPPRRSKPMKPPSVSWARRRAGASYRHRRAARRGVRPYANHSLPAAGSESALRLDRKHPDGLRSALYRLPNRRLIVRWSATTSPF